MISMLCVFLYFYVSLFVFWRGVLELFGRGNLTAFFVKLQGISQVLLCTFLFVFAIITIFISFYIYICFDCKERKCVPRGSM